MSGAVEPEPHLARPAPAGPDPLAVWAEAHAALMDHLERQEPAHALRRLVRSAAHLMGVPVCLVSRAQAHGSPRWEFHGGTGGWSGAASAAGWSLPLQHGGQELGQCHLAMAPPGPAAEAWARCLQPLLDTAAALLGALHETQGLLPPASLSMARTAMREAGTFVWEWDIATDALGDIDEGALMLGYAAHDLGHTQADWNRLIHPDDSDAVEAAYQAHAQGQTDQYRAVYRARAADGSWRWIEERGRIVERDVNGQPRRMFGTQTDATVQHALEQARRDHLAAEAASVAKTQFLSRVSHELRTPLNAVLGFAQLLDLDSASALNDTQRRRVALIRQAGDYLLAMIGDLLDLSLVESGRLQLQVEPTPLAALVEDCLDLVRSQAEAAQVTLQAEALPEGLAVRADAMRLKQVLINLLTNGIKYNKPGGHVRVLAGLDPDWPGQVALQVQDTGMGIPPDQRAGLYQPFNRLGRESSGVPGSGLGLALSQALVTVMGGTLALSRSDDSGAEFVVRLTQA